MMTGAIVLVLLLHQCQPCVAKQLPIVVQAGGNDGENPKAAAVREQLRKRLGEQEEKERATKTELVQKAASYLEQFYEVRAKLLLCTQGPKLCGLHSRHT